MAIINVEVSNTLELSNVKDLKNSLMEYAKIITSTAIFNQNNNVDDLTKTLYNFLEDLYIKEPEEVLNFVSQKPSKKFILGLFEAAGISKHHISKYPDLLKTKTAYLLSQLFETKGSNYTFELFNNIISEFYHNLNFYNVQVEQRKQVSRYESPITTYAFYLKDDGTISNEYPIPEGESEINEGSFIDSELGYKIFSRIDNDHNKVDYIVKFFESTTSKVKLKINFADEVIIPKDVIEHTPMGCFGEPEDLIATSVFLAAEGSKFISGITLPVDGAYLCQNI